MDLKEEFDSAVLEIGKIDFSVCSLDEINVFETTIRYLGGLLAAYDISEHLYPELLEKAKELGEMLYKAFDTPNRLPVMRWNFKNAMAGKKQEAGSSVLVAEVGSLSLEFTRLSQLTGDGKWFDAVQRVMDVFEQEQGRTKLVGMWPVSVNLKEGNFKESGDFTIGGMADSLYEYLPKVGFSRPRMRKMKLTKKNSNICYLEEVVNNIVDFTSIL